MEGAELNYFSNLFGYNDDSSDSPDSPQSPVRAHSPIPAHSSVSPVSSDFDDERGQIDDLGLVDEFVTWDALEDKKREVMSKKERLEEEINRMKEEMKQLDNEIERLETCQMKVGENRPDAYAAQTVSTLAKEARQPCLPVHRCPTEAEASMPHYPVVRTSIELLKVLVHAMISTIFFSRDLLPLRSFGVRDLPTCFSDERFSFEDHFLNNGAEQEEPYPLRLDEGRIPVLERNRDGATDGILDFFENKFAESLMRRELLGLQFLIVKDVDQPLKVYETYTISIDYRGSRGYSDRRGEKPDFHDPKEDYNSSKEVKKAILDMVRHIFVVTNRIVNLPEERSLIFCPFYTPWAPQSNNGDKFDTSWDDVLKFPTISGWTRDTVSSGFIDTGFYGATLTVTFMNPPESNKNPYDVPPPMPIKIRFRDHRRREEDMDWAYGIDWVDKELAERAAVKKAAAEEPTLEEPAPREPVIEEPVPEEPVPEEPVPEESAIKLEEPTIKLEEPVPETATIKPEEPLEEPAIQLEEPCSEEPVPETATTPKRASKRAADEVLGDEGPRKKAKTVHQESCSEEPVPDTATTPKCASNRAAEEAADKTALEKAMRQEAMSNETALEETRIPEPAHEEPVSDRATTIKRGTKRAADEEADNEGPGQKAKTVSKESMLQESWSRRLRPRKRVKYV